MIELKIQIIEQLGGIRVKGDARNKGGPGTKLEKDFAEKYLPIIYNAVDDVNKEMGFNEDYVIHPFEMIRKD